MENMRLSVPENHGDVTTIEAMLSNTPCKAHSLVIQLSSG